MQALWHSVKLSLKKKIPSHSYRMWIEPLVYQSDANGTVVLTCPNFFSRKRVLDHYADMIQAGLSREMGQSTKLAVEICQPVNGVRRGDGAAEMQIQFPEALSILPNGRRLRNNFTFDQFVVGKNNDFAFSAALSMASRELLSQNTLFLLSKTGMGKSHLSQAIGHHILSEKPATKVHYITAEDFTNEVVRAFRNNDVDRFKTKYHNECDVLLLEDVHYLSGKERTQSELSLALDTCCNANKKIIFSSCFLPGDIPKINEKLRSRLTGGVITAIEPPAFNTRMRILKKKAKLNGYAIPLEVLNFLASELTEDVRQLESGLAGVTAKSSLLSLPLDLQLAEGVVRQLISARKSITTAGIKKLVCKHFGVAEKSVVSKSRKRCFLLPRQIAIYLAREYTDAPLQTIGKSFNRYHATALHSYNAVERGLRTDNVLRQKVAFFRKKIDTGDF